MERRLTARYERQQNHLWLAQIAEDPDVHVAARSLRTARDGIRAALKKELGDLTIELAESYQLSNRSSSAVEVALAARKEADSAAAAAASSAAVAACALVAEGLSLRDTAEVLHLSHTRVQQLVRDLESGLG